MVLIQSVELISPGPKGPLSMNAYLVLRKSSFAKKSDTISMHLDAGVAQSAVKCHRIIFLLQQWPWAGGSPLGCDQTHMSSHPENRMIRRG